MHNKSKNLNTLKLQNLNINLLSNHKQVIVGSLYVFDGKK